MSRARIAVVGAGVLGRLVALRAATLNYEVSLFDRGKSDGSASTSFVAEIGIVDSRAASQTAAAGKVCAKGGQCIQEFQPESIRTKRHAGQLRARSPGQKSHGGRGCAT